MERTEPMEETRQSVERLTRDLRNSAILMSNQEARFLVDCYYMLQDNRLRTSAQVRALNEGAEPHLLMGWIEEQSRILENQIKSTLDKFSMANPVGEWSRSICGIGPVIAAGLLAHIDITKAPTVGHIWSFAGLEPNAKWEKGKKRPWNASLKCLCWKIGESFVKVQNNENDIYGQLFVERKAKEIAKNEAGDFEEQAAIGAKRVGKSTEAYKHYSKGRLPPGHIHARAKRWAVKLFLAHWHEVAYREEYGTAPPNPYPIAHLGHTHKIEPSQ